MPRKRKKEPVALSEPLQQVIEKAGLIPATDVLKQLEPAVLELEPLPHQDRPRKRNTPAALYTGPNVRVTTDGISYMVDVKRPLSDQVIDDVRQYVTTEQKDRLAASGFDDVSDLGNGSSWMASKRAVQDAGTDMNVLAVTLDRKGERLGRNR